MKIVKVNTAYKFYLESFQAKNNLDHLSYLEIKKLIDDDFFSWPNSLGRALNKYNIKVVEFLSNFYPLQNAWACEHKLDFNFATYTFDIIEAQIYEEQPDILYMDDYINFNEHWIEKIRKKCPSIKLVMGWCGAPFKELNVFKSYDLVLSCIPELVEKFTQNGVRSFHVNHAFDPLVLEKIKNTIDFKYDFSFIGQIVRGQNYHLEREYLLEQLVKETPITLFSPSFDMHLNIKDYLITTSKQGIYLISKAIPFPIFKAFKKLSRVYEWNELPKLPVNLKLQKFMQPGVFGLEMFKTLKMSKIVLNSHIDISSQSASNMRLFEATGIGSCLLTDFKTNLNDLFLDGKEVVSFNNPAECVERVNFLLKNEKIRNEIALTGQKRTLKDHTFDNRALLIKEIIEKSI
ncbi:MAG: glycosyltransferase [Bacteriovoracaceae bacterium]